MIDQQAVVVMGNPIDGLTIYGPFPCMEEAIEWGGQEGGPWWAVELESPEEQVNRPNFPRSDEWDTTLCIHCTDDPCSCEVVCDRICTSLVACDECSHKKEN